MMNWRLTQLGLDFLAYGPDAKSLRIGTEDYYINQQTGEMGVDYCMGVRNNFRICKTWEKKLNYNEIETTLHYIGIYGDGDWTIYRLLSPVIMAELVKNDFKENLGVRLSFTLIIGERISFFLPIQMINAQ